VPQSAKDRQFATGSCGYIDEILAVCKPFAKKSLVRPNQLTVLYKKNRTSFQPGIASSRDKIVIPPAGLDTIMGQSLSARDADQPPSP
jgi:hypothetical protein